MAYPSRLLLVTLALSFLDAAAAQSAPPSTDPFVKGDVSAREKPSSPPPANAVFVKEIYALKKEDALAVLEDATSGADRYQRVLALESDNKARLLTLTTLANKSGQKATLEGIDLVRYPTNFNPSTDAMPKGSIYPTTFEVRNAGDTWEMEAEFPQGEGKGVITSFDHHVGLLGYLACPSWPGDTIVEQPRFSEQSLAASTVFRLDEPTFLGTFTPSNPNGFLKEDGAPEVSLAFLRVHVLPSEAVVRGPNPPAAKNTVPQGLAVQYSLYSMDRRLAREVVNAGPGATSPWDKLQSALQENRAKIEHVVAITTQSGQKCAGRETDEVVYGNQYSPPFYAYSAGGTDDKKQPAAPSGSPGARISGFTVTTEMKRAGLTFEIEPVLSPDGTAVDLIHEMSAVTYRGDLETKIVPPQPLFESRKFTGAVTVETGKHVLVATLNPPSPDGVNGRSKDDGQTTLVFVRITATP